MFGFIKNNIIDKLKNKSDDTVDGYDESDDPFYSPENMARLRKSIEQLESGKGVIHEIEYN